MRYLSTPTGKKGISLSFTAALLLIPLLTQDTYVLHTVILSMMFSVLCLSWNFICGYSGIFTFGHQGFFGIGAYVSALLVMHAGISPWLGLLIGGVTSMILSILIGLPCLRLRAGAYIALTTVGFAEIARVTCMNLVGLTRGELGLWGIPNLTNVNIGSVLIDFSGVSRIPYYYLMFIILFITSVVFYRLVHSPTGLALKAIRDSRDAAESLGVPITKYKLIAFQMSSFFAGLTGAFYAHYIVILTPSSAFNIELMIGIVAMTLMGGLGTLAGPILGAFGLTIGLECLRGLGEYRFMVYGVLLVIFILFMPRGLIQQIVPDDEEV
jgi:branched-chain amino acid transport system permease protein